jgi:hypothetical protein
MKKWIEKAPKPAAKIDGSSLFDDDDEETPVV